MLHQNHSKTFLRTASQKNGGMENIGMTRAIGHLMMQDRGLPFSVIFVKNQIRYLFPLFLYPVSKVQKLLDIKTKFVGSGFPYVLTSSPTFN